MFSKEINDEIRAKIKDINKLRTVDDRLSQTIEFKNSVQGRINDELDELFSNVNLRKKRDEEQ